MAQEMPNGVPANLTRGSQAENELPVRDSVPLALSLSQNQYVGTASNRQAEARQFVGHNYVAISAVCRFAARATVEIYDDRLKPGVRKSAVSYSGRSQRKSLRNQHGAKWKSFARTPDVMQQADPEFRWWKLAEQPNPWQVGSQFRSHIVQQLRLHGIAMVWNVRNAFGKTVWRFPIPMALVSAIAPGTYKGMPMGGIHVYSFGWMVERFGRAIASDRAGMFIANRDIPMDDLTVYAYPHPYLPGDGASPTTAMESWISLSQKAEKVQSDQYDRGPDKKVIITPTEEAMQDDASLRAYQRKIDKQVRETETGVIVAATGAIHDLTISPDEMGYDSSTLAGSFILSGHCVPKAAVGMQDGMTYGSLAASLRSFTSISVQSDLDIIADEDSALMRAEEGDAFELQFPCPEFDDPELREQQLTNDNAACAMSVGEWRAERGLKPFGDERDRMTIGSTAAREFVPGQASRIAPGSTNGFQGVPSLRGGDGTQQGTETEANESGLPGMAKLLSDLGMFQGGSQSKSLTHAGADLQTRPYVVAVDLDGTLARQDVFDENRIPPPITDMVEAIKSLKDAGCGIVIYTCRDRDSLVALWCDEHGVPFDAINENPWGLPGGGKMAADLYLDNRAVRACDGANATIAAIMDAIDEPSVREAIRHNVYKRRLDRLYGFLFVPCDGSAARISTEGRSVIDPAHLAGDGLETDPHITLLHAVAERGMDVADSLAAVGKFSYTVGNLETFRRDGTAYVVVRVSGAELDGARRLCESSLKHIRSEYEWNPHITLGVIDERFADLYEGRALSMSGQVVRVAKLVYRPAGEPDLVIPLK